MTKKKYMATLVPITCHKCGTWAGDPENPKITYEERMEKYNSWEGFLCKCGHYTALDK